MDTLYGWMMYILSLLTVGGIYAIMGLGLNLQWGITGLFNIGVAGLFAVGGYASAIITTKLTADHLGGFDLPFIVGLLSIHLFLKLIQNLGLGIYAFYRVLLAGVILWVL